MYENTGKKVKTKSFGIRSLYKKCNTHYIKVGGDYYEVGEYKSQLVKKKKVVRKSNNLLGIPKFGNFRF